MYGVVREYQAPTGVTHAVRGRFGHASAAWGVVFARKTSIELYVVRANATFARLELIQSTRIGASVLSLGVLRRAGSGTDMLLIGFDRMRLVALTWDVSTRSWCLEQAFDLGASMGHRYCALADVMTSAELGDVGRKLLRGGTGDLSTPTIRTDPSGRCAAVLAANQDLLYVLPEGGTALNDKELFIIDLRAAYGAANVKDFVFLQGTFEPTIVVLFEPKRTWSGRVTVLRNTSHLLSVAIDVRNKRHQKTWVMEKLPYDAFKLETVPESAEGGVLLLAPNILMQVRHGACVAGLTLNCFGDAYAEEMKGLYDSIRKTDMLMALDAGHCRFMDWEEASGFSRSQNTCLLSLKGGELYFLTLATGSHTSLELQRAGSTVLASEVVPINDRLFVLASRLSDSLVVEYQRTVNEEAAQANQEGTEDMDEADMEMFGLKPAEKKADKEPEDGGTLELFDKDEGTRGVYDDEDELGWVFNQSAEDEKVSKANIRAGKWQLKVKDTVPCFGPGMDIALGVSSSRPIEGALDMVIAGGYAKNGCLAVVHQTVRPIDSTRFKLEGCAGVWTLRDPSVTRQLKEERKKQNQQIAQRNESKRAKNAKKQTARKRYVDKALKKYVEAEREKKKKVLKEAEENAKEKEKPEGKKEENIEEVQPKVEDEEANGNGTDKKRKIEEVVPNGNASPKRMRAENGDAVETTAEDDKVEDKAKKADESKDEVEIPAEIVEEAELAAQEEFKLETEEALLEDVENEEEVHSYLLLSTNENSLVHELEHNFEKKVDYVTDEVTVTAANIMDDNASVQVTKKRIRVVMHGTKECEYVRPDEAADIVEAQIMCPVVLITTADGRCSVFNIRADMYSKRKEEKAAEGAATNDMDTLFDEYGNPLPSAEDGDMVNGDVVANGHDGQDGGTKDGGEEQKAYRNFSIECLFEYDTPTSSTQFVNSACLFRGALSSEVLRDVSNVDESQPEKAVESEQKAEIAGKEEPQLEQEAAKEDAVVEEKKEDDEVDEEDRMLYGDVDEEEEMMLYGDEKEEEKPSVVGTAVPGAATDEKAEDAGVTDTAAAVAVEQRPQEKGVLHFGDKVAQGEVLLVVATKSGALEVRAAALSYKVIFRCDHFFAGPTVLVDGGGGSSAKSRPRAPKKHRIVKLSMHDVQVSADVETLTTPVLVAVAASGLPMIYTGYLAPPKKAVARSKLHFRRFLACDRAASIFAKSMSRTAALRTGGGNAHFAITAFSNVSGRAGIFVAGPVAFFVFAPRGYPRVHEMFHKDAEALMSLDELHAASCERGFVTVAGNGVIRIGSLAVPGDITYDAAAPMRKIALRCTPHKVAYHAGSGTYGVLASMPTLTTRRERMERILHSLEKHDKRHYQSLVVQAEQETEEVQKRVPPLFEELHELRIYRADTWDMIKSFKLNKGEVGLSIENMNVDVFKRRMAGPGVVIPSSFRGEDGNESLFAASMRMRPKNMLVVGTGYLNGEDATSRGRLLLFEVSRQDAHMGAGVHTAFQLQLIAEKQLPSPVTSVASMEGFVIAGVGPQVSVYKLVGDEIVHLSFAFGQLFCTSLATMKQYVVAGDLRKSVSFMYFRARNSSVNFLAKDYEHAATYATNFLVRKDEMSIVVADARGNLHAMRYAHASVPESRGGKRLLVNGGVRLGSQINRLVRLGEKRGGDGRPARGTGRQALLFATLDGGIGMVVAVDARAFDALRRVERAVGASVYVPRYSGVETKTIGRFRPQSAATEMLGQCLLDAREPFEFFSLDMLEAARVAKQADLEWPAVVEALHDVDGVLDVLS